MNCRLKRAIVAKTVKCIVFLWVHPNIAAELNYLQTCTEQAGKARPGIIIYYQYYGQPFRSYSRSSPYRARTAERRTAPCIRELHTHLRKTQVLQRDGLGEEVAQKQKAVQAKTSLIQTRLLDLKICSTNPFLLEHYQARWWMTK